MPVLVSRQQRFFVDHLWSQAYDPQAVYWLYEPGLPSKLLQIEDTSHGSYDMRYLELLRRDLARLAAATPSEPISLDPSVLPRLAHTFLTEIASGIDLAATVTGGAADPADAHDSQCDGWINLAVSDVNVFYKCRDVTLRAVYGTQPYLTIGNHSALLMNKHYLPVIRRPPIGVVGLSKLR